MLSESTVINKLTYRTDIRSQSNWLPQPSELCKYKNYCKLFKTMNMKLKFGLVCQFYRYWANKW